MKNYVQAGNTVTLTPAAAVASGAPALIGALFGVATGNIPANTPGEFELVGVYDLPSAAAVAAQGAKAYWDPDNGVVTPTAGALVAIGAFTEAKANGVTTGRVRLNGVAVG